MTSSERIIQLQEEIQNLQKDNNRIKENKDCQLKIMEILAKYQNRRQDHLQLIIL